MERVCAMMDEAGWSARCLMGKTVCGGVRWWGRRFGRMLAGIGASGTIAFPEGMGREEAKRRAESLEGAATQVASEGAFGRAECHVWRKLGLEVAYRGVGGRSPAVEVDGVPPDRMVAFAQALCEAAGEEQAAVYVGGDILQSVESCEWEGDAADVWWLERQTGERGADGAAPRGTDRGEEEEAWRCGAWCRAAERVVVARVRVEGLGAPEGVFRGAWMSLQKGKKRSGVVFALRWVREGGECVTERALMTTGATLREVEALVGGVPGAVCQAVEVAEEGGALGDGWLEEVFGGSPAGEAGDGWVLEEAWEVAPPSPVVFGWHDRFFAVRGARQGGGRGDLRRETEDAG